tara:strand:+ start:197 stop:394 length:198 start_codon:yes stop_codon:yes gene_type:complete
MRCQFKMSERRVCRVPGQHRSTQRRLPKGRVDEEGLVAHMIELTRQLVDMAIVGLQHCWETLAGK